VAAFRNYLEQEQGLMKSIVVVGAQWGDEGKGKVVDYLAGSFDYIARCAGGHNAGHTVIYDGNRFVLQLIPCGILRPGKHAVIGSGVVVDPVALAAELDTLAKAGIEVNARLHLSSRAHLIFPYHRQMEKAAEAARGAWKIGTTSRGIGPAYEDKMARHGIRVGDLLNPERFREKLERVIASLEELQRTAGTLPTLPISGKRRGRKSMSAKERKVDGAGKSAFGFSRPGPAVADYTQPQQGRGSALTKAGNAPTLKANRNVLPTMAVTLKPKTEITVPKSIRRKPI